MIFLAIEWLLNVVVCSQLNNFNSCFDIRVPCYDQHFYERHFFFKCCDQLFSIHIAETISGADTLTYVPDAAGSQLRMFEDTLALLSDHAAATPILLVLEDVHWADSSTLDLVVFLAHNLDDRPILLLATYRDEYIREDGKWKFKRRQTIGEIPVPRAQGR